MKCFFQDTRDCSDRLYLKQIMEIEWNGAKLFFRKSGNGAETLLLFHGFGQDHSAFDPLIQVLSQRYTCYSFDLFFHGESTWPDEEQPIEKEVWKEMMNRFLQSHAIQNFSLLGYSIGARFALAAFEAYPSRVDSIFLAAPDGIAENQWYRLATGSAMTRSIFRYIVRNPGLFQRFAKFAQALKLVHPNVLRFSWLQMNTADKRKKVYASWITFRKLRFDQKRLTRQINIADIPVVCFAGTKDQLIQSGKLISFCKKIKRGVFQPIETRHHTLIPELINFFKSTKI